MAMITSSLVLDDLIRLADAKGLTTKDVLEANLAHMVTTCREPIIRQTCNARVLELTSVIGTNEDGTAYNDAAVTAEKFIFELSYMLAEWADALVETGGMDMNRGLQNWAIVETIMAENDPEIKRSIEERDGPTRFTRH